MGDERRPRHRRTDRVWTQREHGGDGGGRGCTLGLVLLVVVPVAGGLLAALVVWRVLR